MVEANSMTPPDANTSLTELASGILDDAQTLIKQQFAMLRAEVKQDVQRVTLAAKLLSCGAMIGAIGMAFVSVAFVYLALEYVPELPTWACWALVGLLLLIAGASVYLAGVQLVKTEPTYPNKSLNAMAENLSWIKNPRSESNKK